MWDLHLMAGAAIIMAFVIMAVLLNLVAAFWASARWQINERATLSMMAVNASALSISLAPCARLFAVHMRPNTPVMLSSVQDTNCAQLLTTTVMFMVTATVHGFVFHMTDIDGERTPCTMLFIMLGEVELAAESLLSKLVLQAVVHVEKMAALAPHT